MWQRIIIVAGIGFGIITLLMAVARAEDWRHYRDPTIRFDNVYRPYNRARPVVRQVVIVVVIQSRPLFEDLNVQTMMDRYSTFPAIFGSGWWWNLGHCYR